MTDVQEGTTFKFVSLISIEELSMRLLDSTRVFDTSSVPAVFRSAIPYAYHAGRGVCKSFT